MDTIKILENYLETTSHFIYTCTADEDIREDSGGYGLAPNGYIKNHPGFRKVEPKDIINLSMLPNTILAPGLCIYINEEDNSHNYYGTLEKI